MQEFLDFMPLVRETYIKAITPVCVKYHMTTAEFDVLLFLANNPQFDRATDIVKKRCIVKSQVSTSVSALEKKGYLSRRYQEDDRRTIHLIVNELAQEVIEEGQKAQENFLNIMGHGFSEEQKKNMRKNIQIFVNNMKLFLQERMLFRLDNK